MIGTCALCQKTADLQNSHLIPKWAYRRACEVDPGDAKAPVYVAGGNAVLSNKQTTRHLLCSDCEQRFSNRENYVAGLTELDNGQIKLFRNITRLDTPKKVLASLNNELDGDQIAYFAASVMWRGCVMTGGCKLGLYEPRFRQYLLGTSGFPPEAAISVGLFDQSPNADARGWVSEPASTKTNIGWLHGFLLAGLAFRCWVGKAIPGEWQHVSLASPNPTKYVSIIKPEECADFLAAVEIVGSAQPRGKLAKP
ncbi:MAG: hypothetical protein HYU78_05470 [Rhodocyclales bacterium]|nr:hypothetical protein [Rhodocyclales bacterium]